MGVKTLFADSLLAGSIDAAVRALLQEVQEWNPDQLLVQSESEIVAYLVDKYSARCPVLDRDAMYADQPLDHTRRQDMYSGRSVDVPVTQLTVHVPYDGDRDVFFMRPQQYNHNPPRATVTPTELELTFEDRELDATRVMQQVDATLDAVERWLTWSRQVIDSHNQSLPDTALAAVEKRKSKVLKNRKMVAALGIPVRQREDAAVYTVPVTQRTPAIVRPPTPVASAYVPEPALADEDYEVAIRTVSSGCRQLERSPTTTLDMDEEARRDMLLVGLNAQFEGRAGSEVFNGQGKTDILLRADDRNVFIAECKIWRGVKSFEKAIDQLLSYLVWRDTKAALILFIQTKNGTDVIAKALDAITAHKSYRATRGTPLPNERYDFVLLAEDDPAREIRMAFLPVVIRPSA